MLFHDPAAGGLPVHDHGVQRGLPRLIWAATVAHAAVALLDLTAGAAFLHRVQHGAAGLQNSPRCGWEKHIWERRTDSFQMLVTTQMTLNKYDGKITSRIRNRYPARWLSSNYYNLICICQISIRGRGVKGLDDTKDDQYDGFLLNTELTSIWSLIP